MQKEGPVRDRRRPCLQLWEALSSRVWGGQPGREGFCVMGGSEGERERAPRGHL